jgi:hypothetical protein
VTYPAEQLNARYIAIRAAEAKGLTDRLVEASREKSPEVRRILAPVVVRFWRNNHQEGWVLVERIARGCIRFGGLPNVDVLELFGTVSVGLLNEVRRDPENLLQLGRVWWATLDRLLNSPLGVSVRLMGRGFILRIVAHSAASALKKQPSYQPLNYAELQATFDQPDDFRVYWGQALGCLEHPENAPGPIEEILSDTDLPFDLYLMLACERALIYYGVNSEPAEVMGVLENIFHNGAPWFRQSVLYVLLHVCTGWREVEAGIQERYDALTLQFYRSDSWRLQTPAASYKFTNQLSYADVVAFRAGRQARVLPELLDAAIDAGDSDQLTELFAAIDSIAFSLGETKLALSMIERAYSRDRKLVEELVLTSLAGVRLLNQRQADAFVQEQITFARLPLDALATREPPVRAEDMNSLVDQFVVETMLNSSDFRAQLCRAFSRALTVRTVDQFLVQILQWIRDELSRMPAA